MGLAEKIYEDVKDLSEEKQGDIIEYIEFVKSKEKKRKKKIVDSFIDENIEALNELAK